MSWLNFWWTCLTLMNMTSGHIFGEPLSFQLPWRMSTKLAFTDIHIQHSNGSQNLHAKINTKSFFFAFASKQIKYLRSTSKKTHDFAIFYVCLLQSEFRRKHGTSILAVPICSGLLVNYSTSNWDLTTFCGIGITQESA